jgi:hypothetical protein
MPRTLAIIPNGEEPRVAHRVARWLREGAYKLVATTEARAECVEILVRGKPQVHDVGDLRFVPDNIWLGRVDT